MRSSSQGRAESGKQRSNYTKNIAFSAVTASTVGSYTILDSSAIIRNEKV